MSNKEKFDCYHMIGCMSGTSVDGIDLAYVRFQKTDKWTFKILSTSTVNYDRTWKKKLSQAIQLSPAELQKLDADYTDYLGISIIEFIDNEKVELLDAVASHGHTIFHQPNKGLTMQIGNLGYLADLIGLPVICDFRIQDINLGGQGAPLVHIGDLKLFKNYAAFLNLGGFSNISIFRNGSILAFDICAVNTVLNFLANRLNLPYDDGGKLAANGKIIYKLFEQLRKLNFYSKEPPKSLGIEWVKEAVFTIIEEYQNEDTQDLLYTYTQHIADEIAKHLPEEGLVMITGGAAYNTFLVEAIQKRSQAIIEVPAPEIVDFKEALIFAFLGLLKLRGSINCLASVTGASHDHSTGKIFLPKP